METEFIMTESELVFEYINQRSFWNDYGLMKATKRQLREVIKPVRDSSKDPKIHRNEPCTCGSGLKYKKCCLNGNLR